jgi:hypothetical protein
MVLNHIAAIFLFSGPLFYIGLLMAVDPAGTARLFESFVRVFRNVVPHSSTVASHGGVESGNPDISRRLRVGLRLVGLALLAFAIVA